MSRRPSVTIAASNADTAVLGTPRLLKQGSFKRGQTCGSFENIQIGIGNPLGSGSQGKVYDAVIFYTHNEEDYTYECVAKWINDPSSPNDDSAHIPTEMQVHQHISDTINLPSTQSGLLRIIGVYEDDQGHTYALLPRCEATLKDLIGNVNSLEKNSQDLHHHLMLQLLSSMVDGLTHLESMGLAHGDLKPENIGLREIITGFNQKGLKKEYRFCMLDFGSVIQPEENLVCTPLYMSPELCVGNSKPTIQSDIWAVGAIFRQLRGETIGYGCTIKEQIFVKRGAAYTSARTAKPLSKNKKLKKKTDAQLIAAIKNTSSFSDALDHLIKAMSETLPENRPSIKTLQLARDRLTALLPEITAREKLELDYCLVHGMLSQMLTPGLSRAQTTDSFGGVAETFQDAPPAAMPAKAGSAAATAVEAPEPRTPRNLADTQASPKPTPEKLNPDLLATGEQIAGKGGEPETVKAKRPDSRIRTWLQAEAGRNTSGRFSGARLFKVPVNENPSRQKKQVPTEGDSLSRTA